MKKLILIVSTALLLIGCSKNDVVVVSCENTLQEGSKLITETTIENKITTKLVMIGEFDYEAFPSDVLEIKHNESNQAFFTNYLHTIYGQIGTIDVQYNEDKNNMLVTINREDIEKEFGEEAQTEVDIEQLIKLSEDQGVACEYK